MANKNMSFKMIILLVKSYIDDFKENNKSLAHDIAIVSTIWGPLLFVIVGGIIWKNDGFDGTIMEQLFPAMFFGFIAAFCIVLILGNIFKDSSVVWIIGGIVIFIATVIAYMLNLTTVLTVGAIVGSVILCLLVLIKWITSL